MSDFGHMYAQVGNMFIDAWGKGPFELCVQGKTFRFEDSDMFGPQRIKKDGDPHSINFSGKSPFWEAHRLWVSQGRQVDSDGVSCIWREPIPTIVQRVGNMWLTLQKGEPNAYGTTRYVQVEVPKRQKP